MPSPEDRDLAERVARFLGARRVPGAESVQVQAHRGTVLLSGRLPSAAAQRLCVACCRRVAGVLRVTDRTETPQERLGR